MSTKDFIEKDYYTVLGVPKDATDAEIVDDEKPKGGAA